MKNNTITCTIKYRNKKIKLSRENYSKTELSESKLLDSLIKDLIKIRDKNTILDKY